MVKQSGSLIFTEMNMESRKNWFEMKEKKFLHQVDTFYYSVKLQNDFTMYSEDPDCIKVRKYFQQKLDKITYYNDRDYESFYCSGLEVPLNIKLGWYTKFHKINLECPDMFDIYIAEKVPVSEDGITSVTPEIMVQIRSSLLWQYGATGAFEYSFKTVQAVCQHFNLKISYVTENRTDYCWHTNYLQNPEKFFRDDNFCRMKVTHYRGMNGHVAFKGDDDYEKDYIALGKRNDKCFVRIYLKSKEVIEKGYKGWFLKEWLLNGLISRYDYYVLEKCYEQHRWKYMDKARLEFYLEYGNNENYKKDIRAILDGVTTPSEETVMNLADKLTPCVTKVINIEYQVMRRMSKSFELIPLRDNSDKGVCRRVYDYLDNHALITDYLTHSVLRLVDRNTDTNKRRCDYCGFWKALRSTKFVDVKKPPEDIKMLRNYNRQLNSRIVRKRAVSSAISYSLYMNGLNDNDIRQDAAEILCTLNDNDIEYFKRVKMKRKKQLNNKIYDMPVGPPEERTFLVIDNATGEII